MWSCVLKIRAWCVKIPLHQSLLTPLIDYDGWNWLDWMDGWDCWIEACMLLLSFLFFINHFLTWNHTDLIWSDLIHPPHIWKNQNQNDLKFLWVKKKSSLISCVILDVKSTNQYQSTTLSEASPAFLLFSFYSQTFDWNSPFPFSNNAKEIKIRANSNSLVRSKFILFICSLKFDILLTWEYFS